MNSGQFLNVTRNPVIPVRLGKESRLSETDTEFILGPHGPKSGGCFTSKISCYGPLRLQFPEGKRDGGLLRPNLICQRCGLNTEEWYYINLRLDDIADWKRRLLRCIYASAVPDAQEHIFSVRVREFDQKTAYPCFNTYLSQSQAQSSLYLAIIPSAAQLKFALEASTLMLVSLIKKSRQHEQGVKKTLGY